MPEATMFKAYAALNPGKSYNLGAMNRRRCK